MRTIVGIARVWKRAVNAERGTMERSKYAEEGLRWNDTRIDGVDLETGGIWLTHRGVNQEERAAIPSMS